MLQYWSGIFWFAPNDANCASTPYDKNNEHCVQPFEPEPRAPLDQITFDTPPVLHFYVGNAGNEPNWGVHVNGSGELYYSSQMSHGLAYVQAEQRTVPGPGHTFSAAYYFTDTLTDACNDNLMTTGKNIIAVPAGQLGTTYQCGERFYIDYSQTANPQYANIVFTVGDTGSFGSNSTNPDPNHFDVYVGAAYHSEDQRLTAEWDLKDAQIAPAQ